MNKTNELYRASRAVVDEALYLSQDSSVIHDLKDVLDRFDSYRETSCNEKYDAIMDVCREVVQFDASSESDGTVLFNAITAAYRRGYSEARAEDVDGHGGNVLVPIQDPKEFESWLVREFPSGCIMGDPAYWAKRIARKFIPQSSPNV